MTRDLDRRSFLSVGAAVVGGSFLAWSGAACAPRGEGRPPLAVDMDAVLTMHADGSVVVHVPVPEIGQGVNTALSMLIAEELGIPWDSVRVVPASFGEDMGPRPFAGGSWSVRSHWLPFRQLGAAVREAVQVAAAAHLDVSPASCRIDGGYVRSSEGRRRVALELVLPTAATVVPTDRSAVSLTDPSAFRLLGRDQRAVGVEGITHGQRVYGVDVALPGMRHAVLLRPPVYGAVPRAIDAAATRATPGVIDVVVVAPIGRQERPYADGGVAVVASSTWAAMQGRDALEVEWELGPNVSVDTAEMRARGAALLARDGLDYSVAGARPGAGARVVTADYSVPLLLHVPMEPPVCTVEVRPDGCELWAPTQAPAGARGAVARQLELEPESVTLHLTAIGGGFGRRLSQDFVLEAVEVARQVEGPVQVFWTREDDIRHGFYRPLSLHRLVATLGLDGRPATWDHHQVGTSRYAFRANEHPGRSEFLAPTWPWSFLEGHRLTYTVLESPIDRGPLRAPGNNALAFVVESFLDELALTAGQDPLAYRRALLAGQAIRSHDDEDDFDPARMLGVLEAAVATAGGLSTSEAGVGRGLAAWFTFGSYCAHVVEAHVDPDRGTIDVPRVWSAIDCGFAVHPDGVRAQVEGGVIDGLSAALYGEVRIVEGEVRHGNFDDYPILRHDAAPEVEVVIMPSGAPPTGAGEPPYPPCLPALANAVHAACGARVRDLPITPARVLAALEDRRATPAGGDAGAP
ncbi:MAG: molybdopterin cofactor-binding domain-containing protein [Gemmatimonadales bacterium]